MGHEPAVCPRCRKPAPETPAHPDAVVRCPVDGYACVTRQALEEAGDDPLLGTTVSDRYVVIGRVGAGSMGMVYRARQEAIGRTVALKILRSDRAFDAQAKARFTREARAMSMLTSPHTVTVFDFGEIPEGAGDATPVPGAGSLYLAMALLEGESLGQRLKIRRRLRVDEAVRITRHALASLAEAHDKGIIHRDLKPDNLFLTAVPEGETCKILDFGIAKVVNADAPSVDALETQAGTVFGTPRYMSPEQAQGRPLDPRSDLYALGVLLYQMLTGRPPFVDDDAVVVMARHIKTPPVPPTDAAPDAAIPAALSDLVMRMLAKDPDSRPRSARALATEIGALEASSFGGARAPASATGEMAAVVRDDPLDGARPDRRSRDGSRSQRAVAVAGTAAATVVLGLVLMSRLGPSTGGSATEGTPGAAAPAPPDVTSSGSTAVAENAPAPGASSSSGVAPPATGPGLGASPSASATALGSSPVPRFPKKPPPAASQKKYVRFD